MSQRTDELFDLFWENSKRNPVTIRLFRTRRARQALRRVRSFARRFSVVAPLPGWDELAEIVNPKLMEGSPQLVLFVLPPERSTAQPWRARRALRAAGAGHAAQNLALRLVAAGMVYEVGGLLDGTTAQVALGYACGLPVSPRKAIFCAADR